jgi:hypothetical protein
MSGTYVPDIRTLASQYIFAYAYPIAFVGSVFLGLTELFGYSPSSLINEKIAVGLNLVIGISGLLSVFNWFNQSIPYFGDVIVNRAYIKQSSTA